MRVVLRRRTLPGGRAVAGGFLIAIAAVVVFWAFTRADRTPHQLYVVATQNLVPGERITPDQLAVVPLDIPDGALRDQVFGSPQQLLDAGASVIAPISAGALVEASEVVGRGGAPGTREMSLDIDRSRAVGGTLKPGEFVDILATFGSGPTSFTEVIAPHVEVLTANFDGAGSGSTTELFVFAIPDGISAEAIANDNVAGQLTLVRSAEQPPNSPVTTLPTYQPTPTTTGDGS
jgi:Flp pilus assembly protein CpaB